MHHQVKQTKGMSSSALYAVGGVIVGTTAICHLFDNTRSGVQKQLRGLNEVQSGVATVIDGGTNHVLLPPHLSESPDEVRATSADDSASSNDEDMSILYEWAYEEPTPNMSNVTWERHLAHYDQYDISANMISTSQRRRTNLFSPAPDSVGERFRLKLLWRGGYYWQERASETWWCMGCNGNCNANAVMKLVSEDICSMKKMQVYIPAQSLISFLLSRNHRLIVKPRLAPMPCLNGSGTREEISTVSPEVTCVYRR